jgi:hypothetical protein
MPLHVLAINSSLLLICFKSVHNDFAKSASSNVPETRKWSDIVADRVPNTLEAPQATPQPISTIITSQSSRHSISSWDQRVEKTSKPPTMRKRTTRSRIKKPSIIVVGDSHARGIAGELLHHSNRRHKISGLVKPNAGLTEVLNSASKDLKKLRQIL